MRVHNEFILETLHFSIQLALFASSISFMIFFTKIYLIVYFILGRVKIKMEYIGNKLRRYTTFSKRKTGIMKKAHELSTLTGTQVMLLVASETGHVYAFSTSKLKPMIVSEHGKNLIQGCLSAPDG